MSSVINKTKNTIAIMFSRAKEILLANKLDSESINLMFIAYRNYNSGPEELIQASGWETKPENIKLFLDKVSSKGGQGNEAIEIGFWHVNKENLKQKEKRSRISQVILIGDACPNTKVDVKQKRASRDWSRTKYAVPTFYEVELKVFVADQIKVNSFYLDEIAKSDFQKISQMTGGTSQYLDISDDNVGAENLINCFTGELLNGVGEISGLGSLLANQYDEKYKKGYI